MLVEQFAKCLLEILVESHVLSLNIVVPSLVHGVVDESSRVVHRPPVRIHAHLTAVMIVSHGPWTYLPVEARCDCVIECALRLVSLLGLTHILKEEEFTANVFLKSQVTLQLMILLVDGA